jgi:penicillin-binding protein 2
MRQPNGRLRLAVIGAIVLALFSGLLVRLWFLQVAGGQKLAVAAQRNGDRIMSVPAVRGRILDDQGKVLAEDVVVDTVTVDRQKLTPAIRAELVPKLAVVLAIDPADLTKRIDDPKYAPYAPVPVAVDIDFDQALYLREHASDFPDTTVTRSTVRRYPNGPVGAHVIGYVAKINSQELQANAAAGYTADDFIGKVGAEQLFEHELRGTPGIEKVQLDSLGRVVKTVEERKPVPGNDVQLTLDLGLQKMAEESLQQGITGARTLQNFGDLSHFETLRADSGAVVVLDAHTGSIVALASNPSFDPNDFALGTASSSLFDPNGSLPLLDRALSPLAPGSTFKPFTSMAALEDGILTPNDTYDDTGCFVFGNNEQRCNAGKVANGYVDLRRALTVSSDVFFYNVGNSFWNVYNRDEGGDRSTNHPIGYGIQTVAREFGFGKPTGSGLTNEQSGRVPDLAFNLSINKNNPDSSSRTWRRGDSASLAVGQGDLLVTPLQLATAYSAFLNGGTLYTPRLASAVDAASVGQPAGVKPTVVRALDPTVARKIDLSPDVREPILDGLRGVVSSQAGTAYGAFASYDGPAIAGKTGTAQREAGKQETSWFAGLTDPQNDPSVPQYVVLAMVEQGGFGADVAAPIVRRLIDYLNGNPSPAPVNVGSSGRKQD